MTEKMTHFLHSQSDLEAGLVELVRIDPRLALVAETAGAFDLRRREGGYPGLCAIVCGQQLSTASAAAIRDRLFKAFDPFHHDAVRAARSDKLKRLGLSNAKIKAVKEIGKAVSTGAIDLNAVGEMDADTAHQLLTALHGVGPWTADIYLLFCLGHADAFPAGDLAVQEAARIALNLKKRPDPKALTKIAEAWRPWRGVAAHLMWAYYHVVKRREGISLEAKADKADKAAKAKKHWPQIKKAKKPRTSAKKAVTKTAKGIKRGTRRTPA
jgi:DNA-3-methyladenine glycosylase II